MNKRKYIKQIDALGLVITKLRYDLINDIRELHNHERLQLKPATRKLEKAAREMEKAAKALEDEKPWT